MPKGIDLKQTNRLKNAILLGILPYGTSKRFDIKNGFCCFCSKLYSWMFSLLVLLMRVPIFASLTQQTNQRKMCSTIRCFALRYIVCLTVHWSDSMPMYICMYVCVKFPSVIGFRKFKKWLLLGCFCSKLCSCMFSLSFCGVIAPVVILEGWDKCSAHLFLWLMSWMGVPVLSCQLAMGCH